MDFRKAILTHVTDESYFAVKSTAKSMGGKLHMKIIDLRSDTVTHPTDEMRSAMASAVVGDDVYGDDPTVIQLEELAAKMLGKEAALFMPSGTMANQVALMTFTKRGDEIILGKRSHIAAYEAGAAAVLSGVNYWLVDNDDDSISGDDVHLAVRGKDVHFPDTGLLCLENALGSGRVVPLNKMKEAYDAAKHHDIPVFLDSARLFNAAAFLNVEACEIAKYCDALMFCLSKGLCAPAGSLLVGTKEFISRARRYRKMLGGGMRQAGVLASAGLIALNTMTKRLHIDHKNAKHLAQELDKIPGITVRHDQLDINLIFFSINKENFNHATLPAKMMEHGIKINGVSSGLYRFATHNDVSKDDIEFVLCKITDML